MSSAPHLPDDNKSESLAEAAGRQRLQLLAMGTTELSVASSWGERLLPFILAAMEACWVYAVFTGLAGIGFFQSHEPLMPLWAPFILIAASQWLSGYLERRDVSTTSDQDNTTATVTPGGWWVIALIAGMTLFIIWSRIYAQTAFVLDPGWLLRLLNDILLLNPNAYLVMGILALSVYFCWRGVRLARRQIEPAYVLGVLRMGLIIIVAVIIVRAGQESAGMVFYDEPVLFLLIPLFLFLSLVAHALARAAYVRRYHAVGLEGSILTQERSLMFIIATFGLALLIIALLVGSVANPTYLKEVQGPLAAAYDWLVGVIAHAVVFLVTPFFWLFTLLLGNNRTQFPRIRTFNIGGVKPHKPTTTPDMVLILIPILKVVLPILFVWLVLVLIWWALRRRRAQIAAKQREGEVHESLWSWSLFWIQLKAFLRALFGRFLAHRTASVEAETIPEVSTGGPAARSIREIYRLLLRCAADRGYPRKKAETPYEFRQRLDERTPLAEPRLETITEVYAATRYGGFEPDEAEVARVRGAWTEVEQKWNGN